MHIRSVLMYGAPAIYGYLNQSQRKMIEDVQRKATRTIIPDIDSYNNRLETLGIARLDKYMNTPTENYFSKLLADETHVLHKYLPERQLKYRH